MTVPADSNATPLSFAQRNHFWIRRLHSLAGVLPLGVFIFFHLGTNASILGGEHIFDQNVHRIHALGPLLIPVELVFIFLPLAFHIGYGLVIARQARMNAGTYDYVSNKRFSLQRITAWIATVFIIYHVLHMHWFGKLPAAFGLGQYFYRFNPDDPSGSAAAAIQSSWLIAVWYAVGVVCTVYHFANGLWTSLITWGITIGDRAQRVAGALCTVVGVVLAVAGLGAVIGFSRYQDIIPAVDKSPPAHAALSTDQTAPDNDEM